MTHNNEWQPPTDIWEQRVDDPRAVLHGCASRFIAWRRNSAGRWEMRGAFWSRAEAVAVAAAA